jgi:hypothetical protein
MYVARQRSYQRYTVRWNSRFAIRMGVRADALAAWATNIARYSCLNKTTGRGGAFDNGRSEIRRFAHLQKISPRL